MAPSEFIDLAEVSGIIQPLTRWAIRTAVLHAMAWPQLENRPLGVSVNISVRNLYDPDLIAWTEHLLAETRFAPELLTLEITESEVMDDPFLAVEMLGQLRKLGIHTSIDDFGTGQSSLSYLKHLPIDEMKIDCSFIAGLTASHADETIVRAVIDLGHNLGLLVVAEGVENEETLRRLNELGCDRAQGFHLSPPVRAADLPALLAVPIWSS
jgi:EAL domain-containing protein (putative c-di-GMP-specific phosphodiesterase class I)